jgi:hypothetical protein
MIVIEMGNLLARSRTTRFGLSRDDRIANTYN